MGQIQPKNTAKTVRRRKAKIIAVGTTGQGKTYSSEYAKKNKINLPNPKKLYGGTKKLKTYTLDEVLDEKFGKKGTTKRKNGEIIIDNIAKNLSKNNIMKEQKEKQKAKEQNKITATKISSFLRGLTDAETIYIGHIMDLSSSMRTVVRQYKLTKERFCQEMGIEKRQYNDYMKGAKQFDLKDMAKLNALVCKLVCENADKQAPIKVIGEKQD